MRRQLGYVAVIGVFGGVGVGLTSGSVHETIQYGIAVMTGALLGFGLAKR